MKNPSLVHLIFTLFFSCFILSNCSNPIEKNQNLALIHIQQANAYFDSGQFRASMIEAKNTLQKAPAKIEGYVITAKILNTLGQYKQTLDLLLSINPKIPTNVAYDKLLTEAYIRRKKFHSALKVLEQANQLKQQHPAQHQLLIAECYRELKQFEKSRKIYQKIIQQSPSNADAHIGLALLQLYQNDTVAAEKNLALGAIIEPDNYQIEFIGAQIKFDNKDYSSAESLLTDALFKMQDTDSMTPEKAATLDLLADTLVKQGRAAEAMIYTQKIASAFPGYDLAIQSYNQIEKLVKDGKIEQAEQDLQLLLVDNPEFERASTLLAVIKYIKGDYDAASAFLGKGFDPEIAHPELTKIAALSNLKSQNTKTVVELLENYPNLNEDANLLAIYGSALLSEKEIPKALQVLKRAIKLNISNIPAYLTLAAHYNEKQQPKIALQYIESAYTSEPDNHTASIALVRQYSTLGQIKKAEQHIEEQLKFHNYDSTSLELAGDFYAFQKDLAKALTFYQRALNTDNTSYQASLKVAQSLQLTKANSNKIYTAYSKAIALSPEDPLSFEYMLNYAKLSDSISVGIEAVNKAITTSGSSIGNAVAAIFLSSVNEITQAEMYREKLDGSVVENTVLTHVDEAIFTAKAIAALQQGNIDQAREYAHNGLKLAPQSLRLMKVITDIEFSEKNYREAEKIVAQVTQVNQALGLQLNGDLNQLKEDYATALSSYQQAWHITPDDNLGAKIYHLIPNENTNAKASFLAQWNQKVPNSLSIIEIQSRQLLIAGKHPQAIILMEKIQTARPTNATNLNNLAWSYLQVNNKKALIAGKQAYALSPNNVAIIDTYAWVLYKNNKLGEAKNLSAQAVSLAPKNQEITKHYEIIHTQN